MSYRDGGDVDEALALTLIEDLSADVVTRLTRNADDRAKQVGIHSLPKTTVRFQTTSTPPHILLACSL